MAVTTGRTGLGSSNPGLFKALGGGLLWGSPTPTVNYQRESVRTPRGEAIAGKMGRFGDQLWLQQQAMQRGEGPQIQQYGVQSAQDAGMTQQGLFQGLQARASGQGGGPADAFRQNLMQGLQARASGQGTGAAEAAAQAATEDSIRAARSAAVSQGGLSPAAQLRASMQAQQQIGARGAQQAAQIAGQEQQQAASQLNQAIQVAGQEQSQAAAQLNQALQSQRQAEMARQGQNVGNIFRVQDAYQRSLGGLGQFEQGYANLESQERQRELQAALANQQAQQNSDKGGIFGLFG